MKYKNILVFSPHPDDETFGCGGTIAKRTSEGYKVLIIIMTNGRHAYSKLLNADAEIKPEELMKIRKAEEKRAMRILGLSEENLVFLDFEDGTLEQNRDKAEKEVIRILMKHPPTEVYNVHEGDFHPDHRAANRTVKNAIKRAHIRTAQYEYSISPRHGRLGIWAKLLLSRIRHNILYVDISDFLTLKEKAIKEFKSQVSIISKRQHIPIIRNTTRFLRNKERFFISS